MAVPIMMVTPNYAVLFFSYGLGKSGINKLMPGEMTPTKLFLAGAFSGAMYTFTICPVERIKCLLQVTDTVVLFMIHLINNSLFLEYRFS